MQKIFLAVAALAILSAFSAQSAVPIPYVTFDISGTYPANTTNSQLTTPNASFLIEFTVKQIVPANPLSEPFYFQTPLIDATYSFEGVTHSATTNSSFTRADSGGNAEGIALTFKTGTFVLFGVGPNPSEHSPYLSTRLGSGSTNAEFLVGNLGPGTNWQMGYSPKGAPGVYSLVSVNEVVSRLIPLSIRP